MIKRDMILIPLISIMILILAAGCSNKAKDVTNMDKVKNVQVTAHSGCMETPMDSLESVKTAVNINADICEVDVNMKSDGTLVLKHDAVTDDDTDLVKLQEVFDYIKDKDIKINLDIKNFNAVDEVENEVLNYGLEDRAFLTGITEDQAEILKSRNYKVGYFLNLNLQAKSLVPDYDKYIDEIIDTMKKLGCLGLNSKYTNVTEEATEKIQSSGLQVSVWTVNYKEVMEKYAGMGVNNITTQNPELLMDVINDMAN